MTQAPADVADRIRDVPVVEVFRVVRIDGVHHSERVVAYGASLPSGKVVIEWAGVRRSIQVFDSANDLIRSVAGRANHARLESMGAIPVVDSFSPGGHA